MSLLPTYLDRFACLTSGHAVHSSQEADMQVRLLFGSTGLHNTCMTISGAYSYSQH